jgi:hypothetical protein
LRFGKGKVGWAEASDEDELEEEGQSKEEKVEEARSKLGESEEDAMEENVEEV